MVILHVVNTRDFSFHLPKAAIAQAPARPRDSARLLVASKASASFTDATFRSLPSFLKKGDLLVFNNTRVIPARLTTLCGKEIFLLEKYKGHTWYCLTRGSAFKVGRAFSFPGNTTATVVELLADGRRRVHFSCPPLLLAARHGATPLPPYIQKTQKRDARYQTMFAKKDGSVAAPTAGLHFTPRLMRALAARGVSICFVTLHVGMGTFTGITTKKIEDHTMHTEWCHLPVSTCAAIARTKKRDGRVVAVGTTSCRTLESFAKKPGPLRAGTMNTNLFIRPGFRFSCIDGLITNFHLPESSLIVLVSALLSRKKTLAAYSHAISSGYRFYSYGDGMLILP